MLLLERTHLILEHLALEGALSLMFHFLERALVTIKSRKEREVSRGRTRDFENTYDRDILRIITVASGLKLETEEKYYGQGRDECSRSRRDPRMLEDSVSARPQVDDYW